jgi:ADP-glucose pyrophosphorylase
MALDEETKKSLMKNGGSALAGVLAGAMFFSGSPTYDGKVIEKQEVIVEDCRGTDGTDLDKVISDVRITVEGGEVFDLKLKKADLAPVE